MIKEKDTLFTSPKPPFEFNKEVVEVFDNMIQRSIPHYTDTQKEVAWLVDHLIHPTLPIYDLGCSTGATYYTLMSILNQHNTPYIGLDFSKEMLKKAYQLPHTTIPPEWIHQDLNLPVQLKQCSIVILNLVLQFIKPDNKLPLLQTICDSLILSGHLILIEKVIPTASHHDLFTQRYHQFKHKNGYSQDEIINKQKSLENVLIPQSLPNHYAQLKQVGFSSIDTFFQWYNFVGILAKK